MYEEKYYCFDDDWSDFKDTQPIRQLDFSINTNRVTFDTQKRSFQIKVDASGETFTSYPYFYVYYERAAKNENYRLKHIYRKSTPDSSPDFEKALSKQVFSTLKSEYKFDHTYRDLLMESYRTFTDDESFPPLINPFSGIEVTGKYGAGILEFLSVPFYDKLLDSLEEYEKFKEAFKDIPIDESRLIWGTPAFFSDPIQKKVESLIVYPVIHYVLQPITQASLYTAICPPLIYYSKNIENDLYAYTKYLWQLQVKYKYLIEFCYDEAFYPDVLGTLSPAQRYAIYLTSQNQGNQTFRKETLILSPEIDPCDLSRLGPTVCENNQILPVHSSYELTEQHHTLAEHLGMTPYQLYCQTKNNYRLEIGYTFQTVEEILHLEFTHMLESNLRLRKCKRCGNYFVMKGNFDTNYCTHIAYGETRTCQELASSQNHRLKIATDEAVRTYTRYYKRYAARAYAGTITQEAFKRWKYAAVVKRDECINGQLSIQEFIDWAEAYFPKKKANRKK